MCGSRKYPYPLPQREFHLVPFPPPPPPPPREFLQNKQKPPPPPPQGISLSPPPPPPPNPPLRNFHKVRQSPHQALWKRLFSRKKISKVKNDAVCGYAMVFHFLLLSAALNRNRVNYLQSNLNYKILLIPLNEREKVLSVSYICLP